MSGLNKFMCILFVLSLILYATAGFWMYAVGGLILILGLILFWIKQNKKNNIKDKGHISNGQ